ncbi:hypothetical protein [Pseudoxanthomonas sp. CF385]|uniref:hypothetical protein n=1 Tax=Pseudoxanthomonas sp. CF385 TaxID=1881042 RepID=UPI001C31628D|nr:hypothetical protein [Pseudoxanthomonas sp. CF385]
MEISIVSRTLSSEWHGLSTHLIAKFYEVAQQDGSWVDAGKGVTVCAPLTEAEIDATLNWQSPFEQSGPESSMPALMAMLQSGAIQPVLNSLDSLAETVTDATGTARVLNPVKDKVAAGLKAGARGLEGRTGITRLNSMQVFSGMPPVKITVVALFRAWKDPAKEVEAPVNQLMSWALPEQLSDMGPLLSRAADYAAGGSTSPTDVLAPSKAPSKIAMTYKGKTYAPLVIEFIGQPIASPVSSDGRYVEMLVPMTLCTLTALDRGDWKRINGG